VPQIEGTVQQIFTGAGVFKAGPNKGKAWQRWGFKIDDETTIGTFDAKAGGVVQEGNTYAFEAEADDQGRWNLVKGTIPRLVGGAPKPSGNGKPTPTDRDTSIRQAVAMKEASHYISQRLQPTILEDLAKSLNDEMSLVGKAFNAIDLMLRWGEVKKGEEETPF